MAGRGDVSRRSRETDSNPKGCRVRPHKIYLTNLPERKRGDMTSTTERLEIPALPDSAILMVEVGSTAHGTGIPGGEDHDQLAVVVESPEQLMGLDEKGFRTVMQRTQPEGSRSGPGDIDRTLHSLRRFIRCLLYTSPSPRDRTRSRMPSSA